MKDTSTVLKKNCFQVQTWHPARTQFCPSPIFPCRDSQRAVLSSITGGLDRTAPPWLPRLCCYCGRMNGAEIETKTRGEGYGISPSDRQQSRVMSIPGSSRQSEHWHRKRKPFQWVERDNTHHLTNVITKAFPLWHTHIHRNAFQTLVCSQLQTRKNSSAQKQPPPLFYKVSNSLGFLSTQRHSWAYCYPLCILWQLNPLAIFHRPTACQ